MPTQESVVEWKEGSEGGDRPSRADSIIVLVACFFCLFFSFLLLLVRPSTRRSLPAYFYFCIAPSEILTNIQQLFSAIFSFFISLYKRWMLSLGFCSTQCVDINNGNLRSIDWKCIAFHCFVLPLASCRLSPPPYPYILYLFPSPVGPFLLLVRPLCPNPFSLLCLCPSLYERIKVLSMDLWTIEDDWPHTI